MIIQNIKAYISQITTFFNNYYCSYKQNNENKNLSIDDEWFQKIEKCKQHCETKDDDIINN